VPFLVDPLFVSRLTFEKREVIRVKIPESGKVVLMLVVLRVGNLLGPSGLSTVASVPFPGFWGRSKELFLLLVPSQLNVASY
jgi:hypothetical protein